MIISPIPRLPRIPKGGWNRVALLAWCLWFVALVSCAKVLLK